MRGHLGARWSRPTRAGLPRLWLLSDAARLPDPTAAAWRLPAGAAVIARDLPPYALHRLARVARTRRLRLLIAGDGRAALHHGAGLHVPDRRPTRGLLLFLRHRAGRLLTVAVHGRQGLWQARRLRADAVLISPVFPTASHPGLPTLGPCRWAALARAAPCPALALGGIGARSVGRLPRRCAGIAGIGLFASGGVVGACGVPATLSHGCRGRPE